MSTTSLPPPVQVIPSYEYAIPLSAPPPAATHIEPFHAIPRPKLEKIVFPLPVQVIPSGDVAIVCDVPDPTATHNAPFHATPLALLIIPLPAAIH